MPRGHLDPIHQCNAPSTLLLDVWPRIPPAQTDVRQLPGGYLYSLAVAAQV